MGVKIGTPCLKMNETLPNETLFPNQPLDLLLNLVVLEYSEY